jgi:hypothetical protein
MHWDDVPQLYRWHGKMELASDEPMASDSGGGDEGTNVHWDNMPQLYRWHGKGELASDEPMASGGRERRTLPALPLYGGLGLGL